MRICSSNSASLFTRWMYLLHWRMSCSLFRIGIWFYSQSVCLRVSVCDQYLWLITVFFRTCYLWLTVSGQTYTHSRSFYVARTTGVDSCLRNILLRLYLFWNIPEKKISYSWYRCRGYQASQVNSMFSKAVSRYLLHFSLYWYTDKRSVVNKFPDWIFRARTECSYHTSR